MQKRTDIRYTPHLQEALSRAAAAQRGALAGEAAEWAGTVEGWMREHAPWHDRTGLARRTLHVSVERRPDGVRLAVGGDAPYQEILETEQGGRYAILGPAMRTWLPDLVARTRGGAS